MDIVKRLRERTATWVSVGWDNDDIFDDAANEIERLREVNITQAKWLYDEQQAHKTLRNKVRQWLVDDKLDILKENE